MTIRNNTSYKAFNQDITEVWDRSRQRLQAGAVILAICAFSASAPVWAQDVAEAARQARKNKQGDGLKHVYTEEDLKRKKILTPEDQAALDAKRREQPTPGAAPDALTLDANNLGELPLGDVARMYRALKEWNAITAQPGDFHLPSAAGAELATPKAATSFAIPTPRNAQPANAAPVAPVLANSQTVVAPAFTAATVSAPKSAPEFVMPKPLQAPPSKSATPAPPALSNGVVATSAAFASTAAAIAPAVASGAPTVSAEVAPNAVPVAREFGMPRPREIAPNGTTAPVAPAFTSPVAPATIVVQRGDSFWKLAQVNLGDGHRWHEIAAVNPHIVDPQHLVPGTVLNIGGIVPASPMVPASAGEGQITVQKGDSLWRIAATKLGFGGFWGCIAKANPVIHDANLIYTGQILTVPPSCDEKH
jgi:nucleoid-associated protein YgaU